MIIADAMKAKGLTDNALAEKLSVDPEAVRLWRHGKRRPSPDKAKKLATELDLALHELRPDIWDAPAASGHPVAA